MWSRTVRRMAKFLYFEFVEQIKWRMIYHALCGIAATNLTGTYDWKNTILQITLLSY